MPCKLRRNNARFRHSILLALKTADAMWAVFVFTWQAQIIAQELR
jgi:hypothetical protein